MWNHWGQTWSAYGDQVESNMTQKILIDYSVRKGDWKDSVNNAVSWKTLTTDALGATNIQEWQQSRDVFGDISVLEGRQRLAAGVSAGALTIVPLAPRVPVGQALSTLTRAGGSILNAGGRALSRLFGEVSADSAAATESALERSIKLGNLTKPGKVVAGKYSPRLGKIVIDRSGVREFADTFGRSVREELYRTRYHEAFHRALTPIRRFVSGLIGRSVYRDL